MGGEDRQVEAILGHCEVEKTGSQAPSIELRTHCIRLSTTRTAECHVDCATMGRDRRKDRGIERKSMDSKKSNGCCDGFSENWHVI